MTKTQEGKNLSQSSSPDAATQRVEFEPIMLPDADFYRLRHFWYTHVKFHQKSYVMVGLLLLTVIFGGLLYPYLPLLLPSDVAGEIPTIRAVIDRREDPSLLFYLDVRAPKYVAPSHPATFQIYLARVVEPLPDEKAKFLLGTSPNAPHVLRTIREDIEFQQNVAGGWEASTNLTFPIPSQLDGSHANILLTASTASPQETTQLDKLEFRIPVVRWPVYLASAVAFLSTLGLFSYAMVGSLIKQALRKLRTGSIEE